MITSSRLLKKANFIPCLLMFFAKKLFFPLQKSSKTSLKFGISSCISALHIFNFPNITYNGLLYLVIWLLFFGLFFTNFLWVQKVPSDQYLLKAAGSDNFAFIFWPIFHKSFMSPKGIIGSIYHFRDNQSLRSVCDWL